MAVEPAFLSQDAELYTQIVQGNDKALVRLYDQCRPAVAAYIRRNHGTHDDAEDLLQEAIAILWEKIRCGKFVRNAALRTFVVAVVKNLWLRRLARKRREATLDPSEDATPDDAPSAIDIMMEEEETDAVRRAMDNIGAPCRTLLLLYYYEEKSMEEIARTMGFANADTAKAKKYQCKKRLEALMNPSRAEDGRMP